jgi:hypothetical protein
MLTPVDRFGTVRGRLAAFGSVIAVASIAGAAVGAAASSTAAGMATFVAVCVTLAFALAFSAASRFREDAVALLKAPKPRVRFGEPRPARDEEGAVVVAVPVVNDPLGARAEDLRATIQVESLDGSVLVDELPGTWQASEQPEVSLSANGLARYVNTVVAFAGADEAYALDRRFRIDEDDFLVWVGVTGSNVPTIRTVIRVQRVASALSLVPLDASLAGG